MKITPYTVPKSLQSLSILVLSDLHSKHMDVEAFRTALRFFSNTPKKRRRIFLLGDVLDFEAFVTKTDEYKLAKKFKDFDGYFVPEAREEYDWFEWLLEELKPYVYNYSDVVFFEGNHCERLRRDAFKKIIMHEYAHWFDLPKRLKLEQRGITYIQYNDWLRIETAKRNLMLTHGVYCGANPIKKHVDVARCAVMFGHTHERGARSFKTVDQTVIGYNNPCLCGTEPSYMEGKPQNWSVGFSTIQVTKDNFWVNQFSIEEGVLLDANGRKI